MNIDYQGALGLNRSKHQWCVNIVSHEHTNLHKLVANAFGNYYVTCSLNMHNLQMIKEEYFSVQLLKKCYKIAY